VSVLCKKKIAIRANFVDYCDQSVYNERYMEERMLSPEEAAERLHLSPATVRRLIRLKQLTAYRPGMRKWQIPESAVTAYREASKSEGTRGSAPKGE
jgi:excisionase family DNA binding protein